MSEAQDTITRNRIESDLDRNFIVEAAAGTGKTTSLVNRMVALVETGTCRIDQLAAVTFTRKAAAELQERFQAELRKRAAEADAGDASIHERLNVAADKVNLAFVGTIHSFCASLLRERPIEFGVDPAFRELEEKEDFLIREQAWQENIADLNASEDPLLAQLRDLNINRGQLKSCFDQFIEYRDIQNWPASVPDSIDVETLKQATREYIAEINELLETFPHELDGLIERYWQIARASNRGFRSLGSFFDLLGRFTSKKKGTQYKWAEVPGGSKELCKEHNARWEQFRVSMALPGVEYWNRYRYRFVIDFLRRAVSVYERLKQASGGLDFQDLLLTVTNGLQAHPNLRTYFQDRYTNLLVDEFQDTDPLQAQMMLYLTGSDPVQTDWTKCVPKMGSLFLVGDPKQSIYRFRRGDIITYNKVKEIICNHGGEVLPLVKNFRSRTELREWNNKVYGKKFGDQPTAYSPAAEDMVQGRKDRLLPKNSEQLLCGPYRLELPTDMRIGDVRHYEAESIAKFIRHAIDTGIEVPRTEKELDSSRQTPLRPGDFLIIPWGKKGMSEYTEALERYGIPYQVSGGNPLANNPQLASLIRCLRSIDDPTNPVHYLSVLRSFFGFSDRDLFLLKQAGGSFNFNLPIPEGLSEDLAMRFRSAAKSFQSYQAWMRSLPFATAVSRVAADLGILEAAAVADEGNMQAGGLLKVIEWLRSESWEFDSATDLIQFLEELLEVDDADACPALSPDDNVVRLMNLHKAKGLEAPVVFLAGTSGRYKGDVKCHIDRSAATPTGYMGISAKVNEWKKVDVAVPENWSALLDEEKRFLDAEHERLLYVATTRAGCAAIVSVGKDNANWSSLYPYLDDAPALQIPAEVNVPVAMEPVAGDSVAPGLIKAKWNASLASSYSITTAKKLGLKGKSRPKWEASGDYGHQWGSAVHELLESCHKTPDVDMRPTALRLAGEYHLGSDRVDELIETVRAVIKSDIWRRAQSAKRCFSELPFETTAADENGSTQLVRGVIDLLFEEDDGWVIVDYKTDDITEGQLQSAVDYYMPQLASYATYWNELIGGEVKEKVLFFTRLNLSRVS